MKAPLKKYRFNIIVVLALTTLLFVIIPNEERHYLPIDLKEVKIKSHSVILWVVAILIGILFLFGLRQLKKITDFFYLVLGLGCMAVAFFFLFDSISFATISFINRLSKSQTFDKNYKVTYIDNDNKKLILWDADLNKSVQADQLLKGIDKRKINLSDTLTISFTKGLLGFNFDPTSKTR